MIRNTFAKALRRAGGLAAVAVLLGGCSVLEELSENRREYVAGWRSARVLKVGSLDALSIRPYRATDCRASEAAASAHQQYALVEHQHQHSLWWRVVPVPDDMSVAAGDLVRVNVKRCDDAIRPRDER